MRASNLPRFQKAWEKPMAKLTATFASWRKQHLTIQGKITVIKSMALSVIAYQAQFLPATPNIIKNVENACWKFLWDDKKKGKVNRETCRLPKEDGGIGYPDIEAFFKAFQAK